MADFIKTPFENATFKSKSSSDLDGSVEAGGDIRVAGKDVVIGGPQIADEPSDMFDWLKGLKG
jgi:hypothetical protein